MNKAQKAKIKELESNGWTITVDRDRSQYSSDSVSASKKPLIFEGPLEMVLGMAKRYTPSIND